MKIASAVLVACLCLATQGVDARGSGHSGGSHSGGSHSTGSHGGGTHLRGVYSDGTHSGGHSSTHAGSSRALVRAPRHSTSNHATYKAPDSAYGSKRTKHSRIERSPQQRAAFVRTHPCPSTGKSYGACPGYVVDHVTALKRGGADNPSNMQWQTKEVAKAKDKRE